MANNVLDEDQAKENRHPNVETPADRRRQEAVADEDAMVDVGGSQVNSARMRTGMVLRESQEACEEGATRHIPVRLQVRESGQKRKVAEAMDDETMASRESLPSKKRKVSVVKKTTEQLGR